MGRTDSRAHSPHRYLAARAFYLTFLFISVLAAWSLIRNHDGVESTGVREDVLQRRDEGPTISVVEHAVSTSHRDEAVSCSALVL